MNLPKLYGYDSKKKIKEWSIEANGDEMTVKFGLMGGKIQSKTTKVKGKSIGKSNETSPEEQAIKEAKSKWTKQVDKSYCEDATQIIELKNPMLANPFKSFLGRYFAQPKLDGVRAIAQWKFQKSPEVELKSRGGKSYPVPEHLRPELEMLLRLNKNIPLDGELYIHGKPLNEIVGAAKKVKELSKNLQFWVFDTCDTTLPFSERFENLVEAYSLMPNCNSIVLVDTTLITKEETMKSMHDQYVGAGYEGLILRVPSGMYAYDHRSPSLIKYKEFKDAEWKIIDVIQDKDGRGVFICDCPESKQDDKTFKVVLKGTHDERQSVWDNKGDWTGEWLTVKYQGLTPYNVPQFPVGLQTRKCNDKGEPLE